MAGQWRLGCTVDGMFVDNADSGDLPMLKRPSGEQLMLSLRKGDWLVVARMDRLSRSFMTFGLFLERANNIGVVLHLLDIPRGVLDPSHHHSSILVNILISFARHERRLVGQRTKQSVTALRAQGKRYTRRTPYGYTWQKRGKETFLVPAPEEQAVCIKAAELRASGLSVEKVRQCFAYELKLRNRNGNPFGYKECRNMGLRGVELLQARERQKA